MEITGKIIAEFNERGGVSQRTGNSWKAKSFVLETIPMSPQEFSRKMVFDVFGEDRLNMFNIQIGETMTVSFDIDAHEYNGRWFNDIRAFRIDRTAQNAVPQQPADAAPLQQPAAQPMSGTFQQPIAAAAQPIAAQDDSNGDLPF